MTPDEWNQGVQNEAEHAEDAVWAREARHYLNRSRVWSTVLHLGVCTGVASALAALVSLVTLWPLLVREAGHNGIGVGTLLKWSVLGNPQPLQFTVHSTDPTLSVPFLLVLVGLFGVVTAWRGLPSWISWFACSTGYAVVTACAGLMEPRWTDSLALGLVCVMGVTSIGVLIGQALSKRPWVVP